MVQGRREGGPRKRGVADDGDDGVDIDVSSFGDGPPAIDLGDPGEEMVLCSLAEDIHAPAAPAPPPPMNGSERVLGQMASTAHRAPVPKPPAKLAGGTLMNQKPSRPAMDVELAHGTLSDQSEARPVMDVELETRAAPEARPTMDVELSPSRAPRASAPAAPAAPDPLAFDDVVATFDCVELPDLSPSDVAKRNMSRSMPVRERMGKNARKSDRFRVNNLAVRYDRAHHFIREYAENISQDGLFLAGAKALAEGDELEIRIELPGYGSFPVRAIVVHIVSEEACEGTDKVPGAGLYMTDKPPEFQAALLDYLALLSRRKEFLVYVKDAEVADALDQAGFVVEEAPELEILTEAMGLSEVPVAGIVVPETDEADYERLTRRRGYENQVFAAENPQKLDLVMAGLDANIRKRHSDDPV